MHPSPDTNGGGPIALSIRTLFQIQQLHITEGLRRSYNDSG